MHVDSPVRQPTSQILERLLDHSTPDQVTLAWLIFRLRERSFGLLLLLLAVIGMLPTVGTFTGLLLFVPAYQMIRARPFPVLPRFIVSRPLPMRGVTRVIRRVVPLLRWLERFSYPRWPTPFEATKRGIGVVVALLAVSLLSPLPFSQVIPNLVIILIAVAFLESDGVLLALALVFAIVSIAITVASLWGTVLAVLAL